MNKKPNQLITLIKTPTNDLKGLYGVLSGVGFGRSDGFDFRDRDFIGQDSGIGGFTKGRIDFKAIKSDAPEENLPIA